MSTLINPWEMGEEVQGSIFPDFCLAKYMLVRVAPPKGKSTADGLVGTFLMTSYIDAKENEIKTVEVTESPNGYSIEFPLGKRGLQATKYRGPKSFYKFKHPDTGKWFQISNDKFTQAYAIGHLGNTVTGFEAMNDVEKEDMISEYLWNMYQFGLSMDLNLPSVEDTFKTPEAGLQTSLYRVYTAAKADEKYPDIKITKWEKGHEPLDNEFKEFPSALASALYDEFRKRDDSFDPTQFVEEKNEDGDVI